MDAIMSSIVPYNLNLILADFQRGKIERRTMSRVGLSNC